ncbi:MAG TPA: dihydrofolate reductase family protein [Gemmatimonadaceae bacterium]|nr:dihydrofolate reductase family protein [Gemmatimonadaceae bacterium]
MTRVRVHNFTISLDGYGAGPLQTRETPLGVGGEALHDWFIRTRTFQSMLGKTGGITGVDDDIAARAGKGVGAWIMGRNMFGPIRGEWPDDAWRGWWGKNPPYHGPVFVLTHHARAPIEMEGGTVFHFVTEGHRAAFDRAMEAAGGKDIQIGGGVSTVRQYLEAGVIDELHVAISPILLGSGEHLFYGLDLNALGYACTSHVPSTTATHLILTKRR